MPRYKATIAYDGTLFAGFQRQPNLRTVQGELEKTLTKINRGTPVEVQGAGRTDARVHALGQVIHFDLPECRTEEKIRFALDTQTSADIAVKLVEIVADDRHARFCSHEKIYEFHIQIQKPRSPFKRNFASYFPETLDLEKIEQALKFLKGTHDFTGFTASGSSVVNKVRTIYEATIRKCDDELIFLFAGNGFLYKQIRMMVGTLLKIGGGKMQAEQILEILIEKKKFLTGPSAHPEGLFLKKINYK
jgi:tRNA pseudouridine38-40 synthase